MQVVSATSGPVITRYEIEPAQGVKGSQIVALSKDLARSMSLQAVRIVETIAGKNTMGIELPNEKRQDVMLSEILSFTRVYRSQIQTDRCLGQRHPPARPWSATWQKCRIFWSLV